MSIILKIPVEEINDCIIVQMRKSRGTDFIKNIESEEGQTLIFKKLSNKKNNQEVYILRKSVFSSKRRVEDKIRFRITKDGIIDGNEFDLNTEPGNVKIVIILESPHKHEYNYSYKYHARYPASGSTGDNIEDSLRDIIFWSVICQFEYKEDGLTDISKKLLMSFLKKPKQTLQKIKDSKKENSDKSINELLQFLGINLQGIILEDSPLNNTLIDEFFVGKNIDIIVVNRICYQTSLGSYYESGLIKPLRNGIFKGFWKNDYFSNDFYNRLFEWNPDIIINASTKDVNKINGQEFNDELGNKIKKKNEKLNKEISLFKSNHPGIEPMTNSIEKIKL